MGKYHPYPDHPERFEHCGEVLCREGLTGRCYWEVDWSGRGEEVWTGRRVDIGVTYKGISRREGGDDCWLGFNDKSWSLRCSDNSYYARHNNNSTTIDVPSSSSHRVGVYLDWPADTLSFYRVSSDTLTHLYTFHTTFTEPLYSGFHLWGCGVSASLCQVILNNNDLKDSGVELLSAGLGNPHCKLETLRLSGCLVTEEGCASLVSALRSNPSHLRELDLSYNHPGDSGVRLLSAGLEDPHCRLEKLNVEHGGENRMKPGLRKYVCDLTLDPNTVNRLLSLSEENRKVTWRTEEQPYPDHPERFEDCRQVLCREGLTGRCYWEVEWSGGAVIGVTYKGINRRGRGGVKDCFLGCNDKSWILNCSDNSYSARHNNKPTTIDVCPSSPHRVGVYLDWPAGTLSFYRASSDTLTHLNTFTSTFTEPLYPGFWVWCFADSVSLCQ
uniref:B30.2/SPRY domain-containing protein n=1 Tax=Oncorhynchus mykiss TaxID=8022 RepID=A0A8C7WA61_ONCMY